MHAAHEGVHAIERLERAPRRRPGRPSRVGRRSPSRTRGPARSAASSSLRLDSSSRSIFRSMVARTDSGRSCATSGIDRASATRPCTSAMHAAVAQVPEEVHHEERASLRLRVDQLLELLRKPVIRELEREVAVARRPATRKSSGSSRSTPAACRSCRIRRNGCLASVISDGR